MEKKKRIYLQATTEQNQWCREYIEKAKGLGKRGKFDGEGEKPFWEIRGEVVVEDLLGKPRPDNPGKFDDGKDIEINGKWYDIKVLIGATVFKDRFVHNVSAYQIAYKNDGYIFVHYNVNAAVYTICGWIDKESFLKKATLYKEGTNRMKSNGEPMVAKCDFYEIKDSEINCMDELIGGNNE